MSAFWDASAVVPLCIDQPGAKEATDLLAAGSPVVWWATVVEATSGIVRSRQADPKILAAGLQRLRNLREEWREIEPSERIREIALDNLRRFDLRAADAMQLAAALVWAEERPAGRRFICNDRKLSDAARSLGFDVVSFY